MRLFLISIVVGVVSLQLEPASSQEVRLQPISTQSWQIGMTVKATGATSGIVATMPFPMDWPEQQVRVIKEELTDNVGSVRYKVLSGGVKQMVVSIPRLRGGETASAVVTCEVTRQAILAPESTAELTVPSRPDREMRQYLGTSPSIETSHRDIRSVAADIVAGHEKA